jgi:NAD(P)-dependent dehydrogenase (short-subunit alcohol dehydrogenase family)
MQYSEVSSPATFRLEGKVAVVTGGGRGLGRHAAIGLAQRGMRLAVAARSSQQLAEVERTIMQAGGTAISVAIDVGAPDQVETLRRRVLDELGSPSILINAAGVFGPIQLVRDSDVERWIETIRINTIGPYLTCRAFVDGMIAAGWGRIVNFSSAASLHPPGRMNSAYGTSKVALNQFTRQLAAELAGTGVTANVIHPGEVKTAMWAAIKDESANVTGAGAYRQWAANVAENGGDDPEKTVALINEIIDGKYANTSGQFLWIDGGIQRPIESWS